MRTETINICSFEELSKEAKAKAIESVREEYYEYNDFAQWAVDDCYLFEPNHEELEKLFGEDYNFPLIENTRESIYFDTGRSNFLDCEKAMEVTNDEQFLKWLGIDTSIEGLNEIEFNIFTPNRRNADTIIDFDNYSIAFDEVISNAQIKFDNHIQSILKRIEVDIDYSFTDEAIIEDIESNDYEFLECGTKY